MTFEAYQKYSDYEKSRSRWGSPENLKEDAILFLQRILPIDKKEIEKKIEDQSVEDKGIKFQFKDGSDVIHLFKVGNWRGQWEIYLNKKRADEAEVRAHMNAKYFTPLEIFVKQAMGYDYNASRIDSMKILKAAEANNKSIEKSFEKLSSSDKKKAIAQLIKMGAKEENVKRVFKA